VEVGIEERRSHLLVERGSRSLVVEELRMVVEVEEHHIGLEEAGRREAVDSLVVEEGRRIVPAEEEYHIDRGVEEEVGRMEAVQVVHRMVVGFEEDRENEMVMVRRSHRMVVGMPY